MPMYEFEFETLDGETKRVTRRFSMQEMPTFIKVEDGGNTYIADRVISLTAKMASNWSVKDTVSDLPPENSKPTKP